jgi:hypothetical protein
MLKVILHHLVEFQVPHLSIWMDLGSQIHPKQSNRKSIKRRATGSSL